MVEALVVQVLCTVYQWLLVQRVEAARLVGILAMLGLPGPVLRQLATREVKVGVARVGYLLGCSGRHPASTRHLRWPRYPAVPTTRILSTQRLHAVHIAVLSGTGLH